jgi:hypothetical protein
MYIYGFRLPVWGTGERNLKSLDWLHGDGRGKPHESRALWPPPRWGSSGSECRDGADAAVAAGAQHVIWSTRCHVKTVSGGKDPVGTCNSKAKVMKRHTAPVGDDTCAQALANKHPGVVGLPWIDVV